MTEEATVDSSYGSWIVTIANVTAIASTGNDLPSMENANIRPAIALHIFNETTIEKIKEDLYELVTAYAANHGIAVEMYHDDTINTIMETDNMVMLDVSLEYTFDDEMYADFYIQINRQ